MIIQKFPLTCGCLVYKMEKDNMLWAEVIYCKQHRIEYKHNSENTEKKIYYQVNMLTNIRDQKHLVPTNI